MTKATIKTLRLFCSVRLEISEIMGEHNYNNEHLSTGCESCLDFRLNWTATATELSTWKGVVSLLNNEAAEHFIADRNAEANELKRLVKKFKAEQVEPLSKKLDGYIKEGNRR